MTYVKEREICPSALWDKLWARKERFAKELEEAKRRKEEQKRREQEEENRREEERKRREEEMVREDEEWKAKRAEEERRVRVRARRRSDGQCVLCGNSLGFFQRMMEKDKHSICTEFKE
jgi:hypothetical protein